MFRGRGRGGGFKKPGGGGRGGGKPAGADESISSCIPPDIDWYSVNPPPDYQPGKCRNDPGFSTSAELRTTVDPEQQRAEVEQKQREQERKRKQEQREQQERDKIFRTFGGVNSDGTSALEDNSGAAAAAAQQQDPSQYYVLPQNATTGGGAEDSAALGEVGIPELPKIRVEAGQAKAEDKKAREAQRAEAQDNLLPAAGVLPVTASSSSSSSANSLTGANAARKMQMIVRGVVAEGTEGESDGTATAVDGSSSSSGVEYTMLANMGSHDPEAVERYKQLILRRISTAASTPNNSSGSKRTHVVDTNGGVDLQFMNLAQLNIIQNAGNLAAGYDTILQGLDPAGPCPNSARLFQAAALFARTVLEDPSEARKHTRKALAQLAELVGTDDLPDPQRNPKQFAPVHSLIALAVELEDELLIQEKAGGGSTTAAVASVQRAQQQKLSVLRDAVFISPNDDALWDQLFELEDAANHRAILTQVMELLHQGDSSTTIIPLSLWTRLAKIEHDAASLVAASPSVGTEEQQQQQQQQQLFERARKVISAGLQLHPACPALWLRRAVVEMEQQQQQKQNGSSSRTRRSILTLSREMEATLKEGVEASAHSITMTAESCSSSSEVDNMVSSWLNASIRLLSEQQQQQEVVKWEEWLSPSPPVVAVCAAAVHQSLKQLVNIVRSISHRGTSSSNSSSNNNIICVSSLLCSSTCAVVNEHADKSAARRHAAGSAAAAAAAALGRASNSPLQHQRSVLSTRWNPGAASSSTSTFAACLLLTKTAIDVLGSSLLTEQTLPLGSLFELLLCQVKCGTDAANAQRKAAAISTLSGALDSMFQAQMKQEDDGGDHVDGAAAAAVCNPGCTVESRYRLFMACCGAVVSVTGAECAIEVLRDCKLAPRIWCNIAVSALHTQLGRPSPFQTVVVPSDDDSASSVFVLAHSILAQLAARVVVVGAGATASADGVEVLANDLQALEGVAAERVVAPRLTSNSSAALIAAAAAATAIRTNLLSSLRLLRHTLSLNRAINRQQAPPPLLWDDLAGIDTTLDCRLPLHSILASNVGGVKARALCDDQIRHTETRLTQSLDQREALARQRAPQVQLDASTANVQRRADALCHLVATRILFEAGSPADRVRVLDRFMSDKAVWRRGATASFGLALSSSAVTAPAAAQFPPTAGCQHIALDPVDNALRAAFAQQKEGNSSMSKILFHATNSAFGNDTALFPVAGMDFDGRSRRALPGLDLLMRTFIESAPTAQKGERFKQQMALAKQLCPVSSSSMQQTASSTAPPPPLPFPLLYLTASQLFGANAATKTNPEDTARMERLSAQEAEKALDAAVLIFRDGPCAMPLVMARGPRELIQLVSGQQEDEALLLSLDSGF